MFNNSDEKLSSNIFYQMPVWENEQQKLLESSQAVCFW